MTLRTLICLVTLLLTTQFANAALREVTHTPTGGQFGSIAAALAVATDGDVIEIIDNSAPFTEPVVIDGTTLSKNNLTLRGKASLNPRPKVKGSVINPFDPGIGKVVFTYCFNVDNLRVENLIFEASAGDNVVADARFWNGATLVNCKFDGANAALNAFRSQVATSVINCELIGSPNTVDHFFGGPLILSGTTVKDGNGNGINIGGGQISVTSHSLISTNGFTTILIRDQFAGNPTSVSLQNSIVTMAGTSGGQNMIVINADSGGDKSTLLADNCDFIGNMTGYPDALSNTGAGIILNTRVNRMSVTDSIFFNIASVAWVINNNTQNLGVNFENYNVYQKAPNNLQDQGLAQGTNNVNLADTDVLYNNPLLSDFRVRSNSPAANVNSTGTPTYPGSAGLFVVTITASRNWNLFD